jgi:hypothetical protein
MLGNSTNIYYPKYQLDPVSAQNQPYPSPSYYPYPEPKNTYGLNPMSLTSLKNLDIDDLQDVFGKNFQDQKSNIVGTRLEKERILNEDEEINDLKNSIQRAKLNKMLAKQMYQNQMKRIQNLVNDTKAEEKVLKEIEMEHQKEKDAELKRKNDMLKAKYLIQQQMLEKEKLKEESKKEYEKDRKDIENIIDNIRKEDMLAREEMNRKRNIARSYMENSYARKDYQKKKEKEDEMLEKEKERKYLEEMKKREDELNSQKAKKQFEKDQIFNKLCEQEAQRKAEKDYWENIRNELHSEEENQRIKMAELAEKEKRQRQKEIMIESALQHKKAKEENKKKELEMEIEFKKNYLEKIKEEQELDKLNAQKRKEKELKLKLEAEKQWEMKLKQYQLQKEQELKERENLKAKELAKRYIIEQEKKRLLKENEDLLKGYYPLGYQKGLNSLRDVKSPLPQDDTKREIIKNNIFGNTNPNKSSAYPKYGNIKNFVYDKSAQDVHHKINIQNYPMYNATVNNDYDSYPTPEEYLKMMKQTGQLNYAYAGGKDTTGIPMRGYLPIYQSKTLTNFISSPESSQNTNYSTLGNRRYLNKSLTNNYPEKNVISQARLNNYNYNQNAQEKVPEPA